MFNYCPNRKGFEMGTPILMRSAPKLTALGLMAIFTLGFNFNDALLTLLWLNSGVTETNPFMAYVLQFDTGVFIAIKTLGIALATVFLVHCAMRRYLIAYYGQALLVVVSLTPLLVHLFIYTHTSLY
jgi:hypothetical protein